MLLQLLLFFAAVVVFVFVVGIHVVGYRTSINENRGRSIGNVRLTSSLSPPIVFAAIRTDFAIQRDSAVALERVRVTNSAEDYAKALRLCSGADDGSHAFGRNGWMGRVAHVAVYPVPLSREAVACHWEAGTRSLGESLYVIHRYLSVKRWLRLMSEPYTRSCLVIATHARTRTHSCPPMHPHLAERAICKK